MPTIVYTSSLENIQVDQLRGGFFDSWPNPPAPEVHLRMLQGSYRVWLALDVDTRQVVGFVQAISDGGKIALIGLRNNQQTINPREITDRSISIIGSIDSIDTFKHAVDLINSQTLGLERIITNEYHIGEFQEAVQGLGCNINKRHRNNDISSLKSVIKF